MPPVKPDLGSVVWRAGLPIGIGVLLLVLPTPHGLTPQAWHYFAIFAATIVALITEPIPGAAVGLVAVTTIGVTGLAFSPAQLADPAFKLPAEALKWALGGFVNSTVWLIFGAFVFAMGYEKTGLGRRMALVLVKWLGGRTLGLGYAIALADVALAPFTPSNTARSAGTIFPVIRNIPALYGSGPGPTAGKIGSYLMWTAFATTCVTSSMFITALAPNLLAVEFVRKTIGVELTWGQWFRGFLPIAVLLVALVPWLIYKLYPPEIRSSAEVPRWAADELKKLGPPSWREAVMLTLVLLSLILWVFGGNIIDPTMVALVVISLMLLTGVVSWQDVLSNLPAWNVLAWFATLVVLADGLAKVGFVAWFGKAAAALLGGFPPLVVIVLLVALFYFIHYLFASLTAHTTAVMPVVLAAGAAVPGMPIAKFVLLLAFSIGLMGVLTPYATGPAPVYYGSGFIERRDFWRLGLIFGLIYFVVLLAIGLPTLG